MTSLHIRATTALTALTAGVGGVLVLVGPAGAAAKPLVARNDSVTVSVGTTVKIDVLANDRIAFKKAKANIGLTAVPAPGRGSVVVGSNRHQDVVVRALSTTKPGTFTAAYRVFDAKGRTDKARVTITVVATPVTPPPTSPPVIVPTPVPPTPTTEVPTAASLAVMVAAMPVAAEQRTGYDRDLFRHWNSGLSADGCDTRAEVLRNEAIVPISASTACPYTTTRSGGGQWYSYYDGVTTSDPSSFDIDHMVPLAEAWDSGAHGWTETTREAYANDQGDARALVAVTASSNRGKGDQDPGEWQPLLERCRYAAEWVAVKYRWNLTVDQVEKDSLALLAGGPCVDTTVTVTPR